MRKTTFLSYDHLETWLLSNSERIRAIAPSCVVGILRGGAFPATVVSHMTGAPLAFMRFNRKSGEASWDSALPMPKAGSTVLLCEDMAGSGLTLVTCQKFLESHGLKVHVLTLIFDDYSRSQPELSMDMRGHRVIFPWERHIVTKQAMADQAATNQGLGALPADHTYERWGFDLDGVFLHDVPSHLYETDLLQALTLRKEGVRASHSPQPPQNAVIVTGRQTDSYESTKLWLEANGLGGRELHVRDPNKYASEETGKYKAHTIERLGLTHFMESEPLQALQIAELVPWVHVLQWNLEDRTPRWVRATQASTLPNLGS